MAKETLPGSKRPGSRAGTTVRRDKANGASPPASAADFPPPAAVSETEHAPLPLEAPPLTPEQVEQEDEAFFAYDATSLDEGDVMLAEDRLPATMPPYSQLTPSLPRTSLTWQQRLAQVGAERWAFIGVFVLGAVLRFWGLGDKPLHHDESLHAYFSLQFLLHPAQYVYDPLLHGPFQFHVIPIFYALGSLLHLSGGGANDFTVRILPALMGTAMVAMPYWLREQLGRFGALAMAVLLAVSPSFVYFSRFVRDDIYVTCCTLLIVVGVMQYAATRRFGALLTAVAALVISYTAMENTFFIIAIFGSFLVGLVLWDLGPALGRRMDRLFLERDQPLAGRIVVLIPFLLVMGAAALVGLRKLGELSNTINALAAQHTGATDPLNPDNTIKIYEDRAVTLLLFVSIAIALAVIVTLLVRGNAFNQQPSQQYVNQDGMLVSRAALPRRTDPRTQPVLDTLLSTHWIRWFICFVLAWAIFAAFFWELPANPLDLTAWGNGFRDGIGRGMLQGIYYWLEQQHVARGGQPWYYYLILIPLYEPLVLVFGLAGIVRSIIQPTRFRIFLMYWFVTTLVLYSWAGEKMPWLIVHLVLPMIALSGVAFDWIFSTLAHGARSWWGPTRLMAAIGTALVVISIAATSIALAVGLTLALSVAAIVALGTAVVLEQVARRRLVRHALQHETTLPAPQLMISIRQIIAAACLGLAIVLLLPTLWNMQRVTYYEPSVAPNEMLIYVQTTTDVQKVMDKINTLDQQLYHGTHQLHIGVTGAAVWPFAWYLHDYPNTLYSYTASATGPQPEAIVADLEGGSSQVTTVVGTQFANQQYRLRWWWDESYKLPQCSGTKTTQCFPQATWGTGVGPFEWITYGAYPPVGCQDLTKPKCDPLNAPLNGALAAGRYWSWLWQRQNISGTTPGSTDFVFYVRNDLTATVKP